MKLIIFLIGFLCGAITLIVWTCLVVGAEADERDKQMFEKYLKEKENESRVEQ